MLPSDCDISIVGLSGRFPESDSVSEFLDNLKNGVDMLTTDDRRWPAGVFGIPERHGQLKTIDRIDAGFFQIHGGQAEKMDPQLRLLLQCTFEALNDAGLSPAELKGSNTGVFVGACFSDMHDYTLRNADEVIGYENTGCAHSMFANRLSFSFDWNGPSFTVDTACSSSLVALVQATLALRNGDCDFAVVGGASITLRPEANLAFQKLHMLSPTGACQSFDTSADGYARSEAVGVIILAAKRNGDFRFPVRQPYARILSCATNNDGYTPRGITFPSVEAQTALNGSVCRSSGLLPSQVNYIEAHGTGTIAGDGVELRAIDEVYARYHSKENPLIIGSVKSNMGHCEGAAGAVALIKVCTMFDHSQLPPNLHFRTANSSTSDCLVSGRARVPVTCEPFDGDVAAISSFGFGGSNAHLILRRVRPITAVKTAIEHDPAQTSLHFPDWIAARLKLLYARTEKHAQEIFAAVKKYSREENHLPIVMGPPRMDLDHGRTCTAFPIRAAIIDDQLNVERVTEPSDADRRTRKPIWYVFTGNGGMWIGMGKELYQDSDIFRLTMDEAQAVADELGYDLLRIILDPATDTASITPSEAMMCQVALQIGLVRMMDDMGFHPDGILGHSAGEIACGYADGSLTLRQAILVAHHRNDVISQAQLSPGHMYAVGLSKDLAKERLKGLGLSCVACINDPEGVTISGLAFEIDPIALQLQNEGVFCRFVQTKDIAHHSPMLYPLHDDLVQRLKAIIPNAKPRSPEWITTCCIMSEPAQAEVARMSSAEYYAQNFVAPVEFLTAIGQVPKNAIVIEVGPHSLLASPIRRCRSDLIYFGCMKKGSDGSFTMLNLIASLWQKGVLEDFALSAIPLAPSIMVKNRNLRESLVGWDHSVVFAVPKFIDIHGKTSQGGTEIKFNLSGDDGYLFDHVIDKKPLMPAASYVYAAWKAISEKEGCQLSRCCVKLIDFQVRQAIQISRDMEEIVLRVNLGHGKREKTLEVVRDDELICTGKYQVLNESESAGRHGFLLPSQQIMVSLEDSRDNASTLNKTAFYTAIKKRGYDYDKKFRPIERISRDGRHAYLQWDDASHWIVFIDGLLQALLSPTSRTPTLSVPTKIGELILFPQHRPAVVHYDGIEEKSETKVDPSDCLTYVKVEPWRNAALSKWAIVSGLEMKPLKRDLTETSVVLTEQFWYPLSWLTVSSPTDKALNDYVCSFVATMIRLIGCLPLAQLPTNEDIKKIGDLCQAFRSQRPADVDGATIEAVDKRCNDEDAVLLRIIRHVADQTKNAVENKSLRDLDFMSLMLRHEEFKKVYTLDKLFSANLWSDALFEVIEQTLGWNLNVCEIGSRFGGLSQHVVHRPSVANFTAACRGDDTKDAIDEAVGGAGIVDHCQWEFVKPCPDHMKESFDVCIARDLLVTIEGNKDTLANVVDCVKPGGFLVLFESCGIVPCLMYGLDKRYWRQCGAVQWMSSDSWARIVRDIGLQIVTVASSDHQISLLLRKPGASENPESYGILTSTCNEIETADAFDAWKTRLTEMEPQFERVYLLGSMESGLLGLYRSLVKEDHKGIRLVLWDRDDQVCSSTIDEHVLSLDLGITRVSGENHHFNARNLIHSNVTPGSVLMTVTHSPVQTQRSIINKNTGFNRGCFVKFIRDGDLDSATWIANERLPNSNDEVIDVVSSALNFKDVMLAYGKIDQSAFYGREPPRSVGFEFSGVCRNGGQRVMGMSDDAIATVVYAPTSTIWSIPESWTLQQAASVPVVYATAYYALIVRGRMRSGQSVLIHAGTGGVGQAAIRIALNRGCTVYTTCSNAEKRRFLLQTFSGLQDESIFDSRSTDFERKIMEATDGRGVDLLLNSLSDDKLQASLRCVAQHGHFLEIGKYDIMEHTKLDMNLLVKNITVHGIDVDQLKFNEFLWKEVHELVKIGLHDGEVQPLPVTSFNPDHVADMFRFMGEGNHIGKVILDLSDKQKVAGIESMSCPAFLVNTNSTCVITGGLGGFGMELAIWLVERGARHIVLSGRSGVTKGEQRNLIDLIESRGARVYVTKADLSNPAEVKNLLCDPSRPPVELIFHLAMVLDDGLFAKMTGSRWERVLIPKVQSTRALLNEVHASVPGLKSFVCFSSIAAGIGNGGQTNYSYGNSFMDSMVDTMGKRFNIPMLSVQWGTIGDVGVAANTLDDNFLRDLVIPQSLKSCLQVIDNQLVANKQGVIMSYIPARKASQEGGSKKDIVGAVLGILRIPRESVRSTATLESLGMDSMQSVEVQNTIRRIKSRNIPLDELQKMTMERLEQL